MRRFSTVICLWMFSQAIVLLGALVLSCCGCIGCGPSSVDVQTGADASWNFAEGEAAGDVNPWGGDLPLVGPASSDETDRSRGRDELAKYAAAADEAPAIARAAAPASINWIAPWEPHDDALPTWRHYTSADDDCRFCRLAEAHFADLEIIKQSRAWNCERVLIVGPPDGLPYDVFSAPKSSRDILRPGRAVGCPETPTAYARRLYENWHAIMGRPLPPAK
jgi:hypothetical protein